MADKKTETEIKNLTWSIISGIAIFSLLIMGWYLHEANKVSRNKTLLLMENQKTFEISIAKIAEQKRSVEDKLADMIAKNGEIMAKIAEGASSISSLMAERDRLESDIAVLRKEISELNSENRLLKKSLKMVDKRLRELKTENAGTKDIIDKDTTQLDTIVVSGPKNISGKVLEVNGNYEFVIVSLGSDNGIAPGDTLFISRKKTMLGKVVVEEVQQKYCAAKILYKSLGDVVQKGDSVNVP